MRVNYYRTHMWLSAAVLSDAGVSLAVLFKTFDQLEARGRSASRHKAMMTLVKGYTGMEQITQDNFKQVAKHGLIMPNCNFL